MLIQGVHDANAPDLRAVDLATGAVRWSQPSTLEPATFRLRDGVIVDVVRGTPTGSTEVLDPRTGAVRTTAELPIPGDGGRQVVGDLLLVMGAGVVTAYGLDDLSRRWETPMFAVGDIESCGVLICAVGMEGGIRALDPMTGDVRWETPELAGILAHRGNRALAADQSPEDLPRVVALDLTDGHRVADLGQWLPSQWSPDRAAPMVGVRPLSEGGLLVTVLDAAVTGAPRVEVLSDAVSDCQGSAVVVCRLRTGGFGLWRLSD